MTVEGYAPPLLRFPQASHPEGVSAVSHEDLMPIKLTQKKAPKKRHPNEPKRCFAFPPKAAGALSIMCSSDVFIFLPNQVSSASASMPHVRHCHDAHLSAD